MLLDGRCLLPAGARRALRTAAPGLLALLVAAGWTSAAQAQSLSPTEIYEGETLEFTITAAAVFCTAYKASDAWVQTPSSPSTAGDSDPDGDWFFANSDGTEKFGPPIVTEDFNPATDVQGGGCTIDFHIHANADSDSSEGDETIALETFGFGIGPTVAFSVTLKDGARPAAGDGVTVSESSLALTELHATDSEKTYTVVLDTDPGVGVTITATVPAANAADAEIKTGSASFGGSATLTFTHGDSGNWNAAQTVTVRAKNDGDGANASFNVTHAASAASGPYNNITVSNVAVTVTDAGHGLVVSDETLSVREDDQTTSYTVRLKSQPSGNVVISIASNSGTAEVAPATLPAFTTGNWYIPVTVTVTGKDQGTAYMDHSVSSTADTTNYPLTSSLPSVRVTVTADARPRVSFSAAAYDATEPAATTNAAVGLTLSQAHSADALVSVTVSGGSATAGSDFTAGPYSATILASETTATINVPILHDSADEPNETITLKIDESSLPPGVALGSQTTATLTIVDNDATSVALAGSGAVEEGRSDDVDVTLTLGRDLVGTETVTAPLAISGTGITAGDYTIELGEVSLLTQVNRGVTLSTANPHSAANPAVVFAASGNIRPRVAKLEVRAVQDATDEGGTETLTVGFGSGSRAVTSNLDRASGAGAAGTTTSGSATVTITDGANVTITESGAPAATVVSEDGTTTTDSYGIALNIAPRHNVEITVRAGDGVLVNKTGGIAAATQTLSFGPGGTTAWNTAQTITVTGVDDDIDNAGDARTAKITHDAFSTDQGFNFTGAGEVSVTVTDDDTAGVTVTPTTLSIGENGGADTYTVTLNSQPLRDVTVTVDAGDGSVAKVDGPDNTTVYTNTETLTFSPTAAANLWRTAQTVTVQGQDDSVLNAMARTATIAHSIASAAHGDGGRYMTSMTIDGVDITLADDEVPVLTVAEKNGNASVAEGGSATFTVTSSFPAPAGGLPVTLPTLTFSSGYSGSISGNPASLAIPANGTAADFTVNVADDDADRLDGTLNVELQAGAGYVLGATSSVELSVPDDDATSLTLAGSAGSLTEGTTKAIRLTLSRGLVKGESLTVPLTFAGSAGRNSDYTLAGTRATGVAYSNLNTGSAQVVFTGPNTGTSAAEATLTLTATDDGTAEDPETVDVGLGAVAETGLAGLTKADNLAQFNIEDPVPDAPPELTLHAPATTTLPEDGAPLEFYLDVSPPFSEAAGGIVHIKSSGRAQRRTGRGAGNDDYRLEALRGGSWERVSGSLVFPGEGASSVRLRVAPIADSRVESDESIVIELKGQPQAHKDLGDPEYTLGSPKRVAFTLTDPDAPPPTPPAASFALAASNPAEDAGAHEVTVNLDRVAPAGGLTLAYAVSGNATEGSGNDFTIADKGAAAVAAGARTATIAVAIVDDAVNESDETVVLTLTGGDGYTLGATKVHTLTIADDDAPPGTPEVSLSVNNGGAVTEGGALTLTAAVTQAPSGGALSIPVQRVAAESTAAAGDYTLAANITIANGATSGTATLSARTDTDDEAEETLRLRLGAAPQGYVNGANSFVDITITDNTATKVTLTTPDTTATEADATDTAAIKLTLGRPLVGAESLIVPLQFAGGAPGTDFDLALSGSPTGVSFDTATGQVTFAGPGASATEATVLLTATVDTNAADATVTVSIPSSSTAGTPRLTAANLDGGATGTRSGNGRITLKDAGLNVRTIGWAATTLAANETASAGSVNVALSSSGTAAITFRVCLSDGTATLGNDYEGVITAADRCTGSNGRADFTIAAGSTTQSVSFASIVDTADEPDETYTATISLPTAVAGLGINPATLNVTLRDDDATGVRLARVGSGAIYEAGKAELTVTLGRRLVAGEIIDVPLSVGGANVTTGDWSLTKKPGAGNTGVTLSNTSTNTPNLRFAGANARVATLELTATVDGVTESGGETLTFALGPDGTGTNGFDRAGLGTNVGGGADPHNTDHSVNVTVNDGRTLGWASTALTVNESTNAANLSAELSEGTGPVTFRVCLAGGSATFGEDFTGVVRSNARCTGSGGGNADPTIASGASSRQVSPGIDQRTLDEPSETFTATLSLPAPVAGLSVDSAKETATVTIVDKDPTLVTLSAPSGNVAENGGVKDITLALGRALVSPESLTVPLSFGGVALRGSEYTVACPNPGPGVQCSNLNSGSANVTFTGGANAARSVTLTVTGVKDHVEEGSESVTVALGTLNAGSGTNLDGGAAGSSSVSFDVAEEATIGFTSAAFEVDEGAGDWYATVQLSEPVPARVRVDVAVEAGSADSRDYRRPNPMYFDIPAGDTTGRFGPIAIRQDTRSEGDETFYLTLVRARDTSTGRLLTFDRGEAGVTIRDDEPPEAGVTVSRRDVVLTEGGAPGSYTVALRLAPTSDVTLTATVEDPTAARIHTGQGTPAKRLTLVFTPQDWDELRTIVVTPQDDADADEERPYIEHRLSGAGDYERAQRRYVTVVVTDDDEPPTVPVVTIKGGNAVTEGGRARFTLRARPVPQSPVDVTVDVVDSGNFALSGQAGSKTVTIGSGGSATLEVRTDDDSQEEDDGRLTATLAAGSGYTVDPQQKTASVAVNDDDAPLTPVVSFDLASASAGEASGTHNVTLDLSPPPASAITVRYGVGGTATEGRGNDFTIANSGSLQVAGGANSATITVAIRDDNDDEANETVELTLTDSADYDPGAPGSHVLTITDNDNPPPATPVVSIRGGNIITEGGNATFNLSANPPPQSTISVNVTVVDSGDFAESGQAGARRVSIGTGGTGTLTVGTDDDDTDEPPGTLTATVTGGQGYSPSNNQASASVTVNDNDDPRPVVSIGGGNTVTEGNPASFTLEASPPPRSTISVNVTVSQTGNFAGSGQTGSKRFNIGSSGTATFDVTTIDDGQDEPNGAIRARVDSGPGYDVDSQKASASVTVEDDDLAPPEIRISRDAASVEEGDPASFTITANRAPKADLTVHLSISQNGDFAATGARTVTILANTTTVTHSVTTINDDADEADGSVTARVVPRSHYRVARAPANQASVTVTDNDVPVPEVRVTSEQSAFETDFEGASLEFTLRADLVPEADIDVTVNVAQPGHAFVDAGDTGDRTVTLRANRRTATFTVPTNDDNVEENPSHATVTVTVRTGAGYTVAPSPKHTASAEVHDNDGLPIVSILDAETEEGDDLDFYVQLSKPVAHEVEACFRSETGEYEGRNWGTARSSSDFIYKGRCITIWPGRTKGEDWYVTLDDSHDEGDEWFTIVLWRAEGATIGDGEAIATIRNSDPLPSAFLGRFGRGLAEQAVGGITARLKAGRTPGFSGQFLGGGRRAVDTEAAERELALARDQAPAFAVTGAGMNGTGMATLSGHDTLFPADSVTGHAPPATATRTITLAEALAGSAFTYTREADEAGGSVGLWGRGMHSTFSGAEGTLNVDGELTTGLIGADYARQDWQAGLAVLLTGGEGSFRGTTGNGTLDTSLTAFVPYAARQAGRLEVWGAAGVGFGAMTLSETVAEVNSTESLTTDLGWQMAAGGVRSNLGPFLGETGPDLTLVGDAQWTRTTSEKTLGLAGSEAQTTRVRVGVEGGWSLTFAEQSLRPTIEAGVRYDGGDADTGLGMELGAGVRWEQTRWGLAVDMEGRTLVAHEDKSFKHSGFSASLTFDPDLTSLLGPSLTLTHRLGGPSSGGLAALFAEPLPGSQSGHNAGGHWQAEAAYGMEVFRGRFIGTPTLGYTLSGQAGGYRLGWKLSPARTDRLNLSAEVAATRNELPGAAADHGIGLNLRSQW